MEKEVIARNFGLLREQQKLTQEQLAKYLGVKSRESISQYENGTIDIPLSVLEKASNLFGIDLLDFFTENEDELKTTLHFAFRAENLNADDMNSIGEFKKIVKNYLRMNKLVKSC